MGDKDVAEPLAEEAKYFTEMRLLQRDVTVVLEGTLFLSELWFPVRGFSSYICVSFLLKELHYFSLTGQGVTGQNVLGTVLHPKGNISELLLESGKDLFYF